MRITPLNIVMAGLLTWLIWQILDKEILLSRIAWVSILFVILVAADQLFRVLIRNLRRIWLIEGGFLILVLIVTWIVTSM